MYWLLRAIFAILGSFPLSRTRKFASAIGVIAWYILPTRRKTAIVNASIVGAENPVRIAKESFKHTFMSYLEVVYSKHVDKEFVAKYVTFENTEHYEKLVRSGQKFALISAHLGSWDLVTPVYANNFNAKVMIVGRPTKSKTLNRLIDYTRNSDNIVYVQQDGFIDKIREYEQMGYTPGSLLDHIGIGNNTMFVPFFGYKVETLAGTAVIAARKKIPMLPAYLIRTDNGFLFTLDEPIYPNLDLKPQERIYDLAMRMNEEYERIIRKYPEQWYLLHRRFKRVEEGIIDVKTNRRKTRSVYR